MSRAFQNGSEAARDFGPGNAIILSNTPITSFQSSDFIRYLNGTGLPVLAGSAIQGAERSGHSPLG